MAQVLSRGFILFLFCCFSAVLVALPSPALSLTEGRDEDGIDLVRGAGERFTIWPWEGVTLHLTYSEGDTIVVDIDFPVDDEDAVARERIASHRGALPADGSERDSAFSLVSRTSAAVVAPLRRAARACTVFSVIARATVAILGLMFF